MSNDFYKALKALSTIGAIAGFILWLRKRL